MAAHPAPKLPPLIREQRRWIRTRQQLADALGRHHLAGAPPELRVLVREIEQVLDAVDRRLDVLL